LKARGAALICASDLLICETITVVIVAVTELLLRDAPPKITAIAEPVEVLIKLVWVVLLWAVITAITDPVTVCVELIKVARAWTVIAPLADPILIVELIRAEPCEVTL
jgi:uncharacterized membrane protein